MSEQQMYQLPANEEYLQTKEPTPETTLESINDECLRYIFQFLNIFETVNLAATCTRLQNFANDYILSKSAKDIKIKLDAFTDNSTSVDGLPELFGSIANFADRLSFVVSDDLCEDGLLTVRNVEKIVLLCQNLRYLCFERVDFKELDIMKHVGTNLKELKFVECYSGSTIDWSDILRRLPHLNRITLTDCNIVCNFFDYNHVLSSLTIERCCVDDKEEHFVRYLDVNGHSLQELNLMGFSGSPHFDSIVTLITEKLPNLQNLTIEDKLTEKLTNSVSKFPNLKSLKIHCEGQCVKTLLRTLSNCGVIVDLEIKYFDIAEWDDNEIPLLFSQLRSLSLRLSPSKPTEYIWRLMTKSQLPEINFVLVDGYEQDVHNILKFFESKKLLESMNVTFRCHTFFESYDIFASFSFLRGIIEILEADCDRPFLTLQIPSLTIGKNEVSDQTQMLFFLYFEYLQGELLNANRHRLSLNAKVKTPTTEICVHNRVVDTGDAIMDDYDYDDFEDDYDDFEVEYDVDHGFF